MSLNLDAKRFLVIGSNSFSGSNCVNQLLKKGYHVCGISRSNEPNKIRKFLINFIDNFE